VQVSVLTASDFACHRAFHFKYVRVWKISLHGLCYSPHLQELLGGAGGACAATRHAALQCCSGGSVFARVPSFCPPPHVSPYSHVVVGGGACGSFMAVQLRT
jgi:hypothetical protein